MLNENPTQETPPRSFRKSLKFWIADCSLFAVFVTQIILYMGVGKEDAYISFRYARNLVRGDGLVYNPGEYVEGISNLLWTLCLAGLHACGLSLEVSFRILCLVCAVGAFLVLWWTARRFFGKASWVARLPLLAIACMSSMPGSYGNGLEGSAVGLSVALMIAGAALPHLGPMTLGSVLMILNRPEGVGVVGIAGLWLLYETWRGRQSARKFAAFAIIVILVFVLLTVFRLSYYGDYIPNTLRAKATGLPGWAQMSAQYLGWTYLGKYLLYIGWPVLLLLAVALWFRQRRSLSVFLSLILLANAFVVWSNGGDWMVHYRLLTPYYPCAAFMAILGIEALRQRNRWVYWIAVVLCCVGAVRMLDFPGIASEWQRFSMTWNLSIREPDLRTYRIDDHLSVRDFTRPDDRFVLESGGNPGYMLDGVNVIEMNGLTDRAIATLSNPYAYRRSATGTINWIELFKKEPTYILFNMLSTFHYTTQITAIPELQDKLGQFLFVQKSPLGPGVFTLGFNALLVRGDRATLTAFVQDYGAFAPVCEFRNSEYQKYYILPMQDPATGQYRNDFFMTPWDVAPWLTDTGAQLQAAWRSWGRNQRLSCEMPLHAGINEVTKSILDGAPLMLLCELDKKADPQAVVTVIRQKDGVLPEVVASADLREQPKTMRRVWVLPVLGDPSGVGGRITIKAEAAAEGVLRFAAHRWVKVPFPDFPKWFDAADATQ